MTFKHRETREALSSYRDAVWSYMLEHSEVEPRGTLFVKFRTTNRNTYEGHVNARWKGGYHRGNPAEREKSHLEKSFQIERERWERRERYLMNRIRGRRVSAIRRIFSIFLPIKKNGRDKI